MDDRKLIANVQYPLSVRCMSWLSALSDLLGGLGLPSAGLEDKQRLNSSSSEGSIIVGLFYDVFFPRIHLSSRGRINLPDSYTIKVCMYVVLFYGHT